MSDTNESEEFAWPKPGQLDLRDDLTRKEVIDALYAATSLRLDNRVPPSAPTFLAVCAPTDDQQLIVVVCVRSTKNDPWVIIGARWAREGERLMWRKYTS